MQVVPDPGWVQVWIGVIALVVTIAVTVGGAAWGLSQWLAGVRREVIAQASRVNDETRQQMVRERERCEEERRRCQEEQLLQTAKVAGVVEKNTNAFTSLATSVQTLGENIHRLGDQIQHNELIEALRTGEQQRERDAAERELESAKADIRKLKEA